MTCKVNESIGIGEKVASVCVFHWPQVSQILFMPVYHTYLLGHVLLAQSYHAHNWPSMLGNGRQ